MKRSITGRAMLLVTLVVLSVYCFLPSLPIYSSMPEGVKRYFPATGVVLGLDLQGGIHLVLRVMEDKAIENLMERRTENIDALLGETNVKFDKVELFDKDQIRVVLSSTDDVEEVKKMLKKNYPNIVVAGEDGATLSFALREGEKIRIKSNATTRALETIRNRIDQFGVREPLIQRQGTNEILVQLAGIKDPERAIKLIGERAVLEFKLVNDEDPLVGELPGLVSLEEEQPLLDKYKDKIPDGYEILFMNNDRGPAEAVKAGKTPLIVKKNASLTGDLLTDAIVRINEFGEPIVSITFNDLGAKLFADVTGGNVGKRLAIVLDDSIYSAPNIQDKISGGQAQITGRFTPDDANDLSIVLRAGALPAPVEIPHKLIVGPSLGRDSIRKGIFSIIIAGVLVLVFIAIYYKWSGIIANAAMMLNLIGLMGAFALFNATLTLPGIAGIVLTIGIGIDSNVLILERIREELRIGKSVRLAITAGYDKAFLSIMDAHVTTLITALVLFLFGTGPIKGFAVGLSLGIIINLFTALVGTRIVYDYMNNKNMIKEMSI